MSREKTGGVRLEKMQRGGQCIDLYNQTVWEDVFVTITTRVDQCNHYWVTIEC